MPLEPRPKPESGRPAAERQFVDREEPIALFQAALKEPQRSKPLVLVFHGGAGTGKSRLRRELVRLVDSRQQTVDRVVVTATLDFDVPIHRQPDAALLFLRKAIGEACQACFPSFDLAYAAYWQKSHPDAPLGDDLKPLREPGSLLSQLLDESGKLPLIGLIPKVSALVDSRPNTVDRDSPTSYLLPPTYYATWWRERGERELEDLPQMEPAAIVEQLPKLWATDLKEFIVHRSSFIVDRRAVLFIDSYEKLLQTVDGVRDTVDASQKTDAWVRELVKQLPEVLWVMSGRQKLRWEEVEKEWGDVLSQHELGALPEHSARQFLSSCGITDEPIQDAIAKGSQGLPHYLNLAVDTYLEIEQSGQRAGSVQSLFSGAESSDSPEQLFAQFIRHLDQPEIATLQVLSASRFWNYGLFEHLVTEYQTGYPLTAYDDLSRFSFVGEGAAPETRTMHDLMREALQEHQAPELRRRVHLFLHELYAKQLEGLDVKGITEKHKAALTEAFYHGRQVKSAAEFWTWFRAALRVFDDAGQCRLLVPLLRETVESLVATGLGLAKPNLAEPLFELARQLDENGDYDEAEPLYRRALAMVEGAHEPENTLVLNCLSMLAQLLRKRARFEEAEVMCRRVVELRNKLGGPAIDHAEAFDNLALVLAEEEKYGEAEELFRRALAISEKEVGPEHRKTGTKLCNLATMLWSQRRFGEAESLFRSALAIDEKVLGVNHPSLVFTLDGLANTLHNLGRYQEAEALLRRSLKLCEENLGPEHPDTAVCLNNLGSLLRAQSRFAEAEPLLRRALKVHQKKMGHDHPLTMRMASNLFVALVRSGNHVEAESMILSAIATREEKLGPDHPLTIFAVHWGGVLYKNQGRYDEAETYLRRAVEANTRIRGPEHLDTLGSWAALGGLEERRGRYAEAESVYRDVLPKREKVLGPENPAVAEVAFQLAGICSRDGRYAEAEAFYRRALAIREKVFGPDHALVAETLEGLAKVCEQTGRTAEAQELAARAKRIRAQAPTEKAVDSRQ